VAEAVPLDSTWLRAHPLPALDPNSDKNARGRVFVIGGSRRVPGGLLLTAEAALRAGAGKVQAAVPEGIALALGMTMPEIAVFASKETPSGEIALIDADALTAMAKSDAIIAGPAMSDSVMGGAMVDMLIEASSHSQTLVIDAAALMELSHRSALLASRPSPAILTPHIGEMAAMLECDAAEIEADRAAAVRRAAELYGSIVALKGSLTLIASPEDQLFAYAGGGVGLATGGSGDVLAGIAAGFASRRGEPLVAALWAIWLHGEAGRRCAEQIGPVGYLARELLTHIASLSQSI